jgi:hypothetical protein
MIILKTVTSTFGLYMMPRFRQQLSALNNEDVHIDTLSKNSNQEYFMIKSLKEVISHHSIIILYHAYFQSRMKYSIIFWLTDSYSKKLFCLQKQGFTFDFHD